MTLPPVENQNRLITEVLLAGPHDGRYLLTVLELGSGNIESKTWELLLECLRYSEYASSWRGDFGRQRDSLPKPNSILELAILYLNKSLAEIDQFDARSTIQEEFILTLTRLIANCCADSERNRRLAIQAGVVECFMAALAEGLDPNVLVPATYNVCIDISDPSELFPLSNTAEPNSMPVTVAEERLAVGKSKPANVYLGLQVLLNPAIAQNCSNDILEYLTDLMVMAATPITALDVNFIGEDDSSLEEILQQLCSSNVGIFLAGSSVRCRISVIQTVLAVSHLQLSKTILARTGDIFPLALIADYTCESDEDFGEDEEEQQENKKSLEDLKTSATKLVYEICQMPQFRDPPKYGTARQSVEILYDQNSSLSGSYRYAIALLMLYGFVDSDARANLLILENENFISRILLIMTSSDKTVIYLALALASKIAVTWNLRSKFHEAGAFTVIHFLLSSPNLGYDIPLNAITFLELLIKGQLNHINTTIYSSQQKKKALLNTIFALFDRNQDAICFEIGRLMIEFISTLAPTTQSARRTSDNYDLNDFISACDKQTLARILIFMGTKGLQNDPIIALRIWYALGLLCLIPLGREITEIVVRDSEIAEQMKQAISSADDTPTKRNILSIKWALDGQQQSTQQSAENLDDAVARMSLD